MLHSRVSQIVIFTVVAALLVFGVTLLMQWRGTTASKGSANVPVAPALLEFEEATSPPQGSGKENRLDEFAWDQEASHEFWFTNVSGDDHSGKDEVEVGINRMMKCTCSNLEIGLAPEDWRSSFRKWKEVPAYKRAEILKDVTWQELDRKDIKADRPERTFKVPPGRAGWVRVMWRNVTPNELKQMDVKTFTASLWTGNDHTTGKEIDLNTGCVFVNPVHLQTVESVEDKEFETTYRFRESISPDSQPEARFLCWSTIRKFDWEHDLLPIEDPGVVWEKPEELPPQVLHDLEEKSNRNVKYGCLVKFRLKGLNLGQFHREFEISRDHTVSLKMGVSGYVRGPVKMRFGNVNEPTNVIDLGLFPRTKGSSKTVYLEAEQAGTTLELDKAKLADFLEVSLTKDADSANQWQMTVRVPQKKAFNLRGGPLGDKDDVIVVELIIKQPGKEAQRMRIPITGSVEN
jgi:hypothetical protein